MLKLFPDQLFLSEKCEINDKYVPCSQNIIRKNGVPSPDGKILCLSSDGCDFRQCEFHFAHIETPKD